MCASGSRPSLPRAAWRTGWTTPQVRGNAYLARFSLASDTGDPGLLADAHYDLGFLSMIAKDEAGLRDHEEQALELYLAAGNEQGAIRTRQALVLAIFLAGDYATARRLEEANLEAFTRSGSQYEIADSTTLLSAILYRLGEPAGSWQRMVDGLRFFAANEAASGLARGLAMGAIIQFRHGDPRFGIRLAAKAYQLVREQEVMLAPVKVLHLPDPLDLAAEAYGPERAQELLDEAAAIPMAQVVAEVLAAGLPSVVPTAEPTTGAAVSG